MSDEVQKNNVHIKQVPIVEEILLNGKQLFHQSFGQEPVLACCAPGRVNLIGEHVDYNEGFVLPMALPLMTLIIGGPADSKTPRQVDLITSSTVVDEPRRVKFSVIDHQPEPKSKWINYVKGVISGFTEASGKIPAGFNAVIVSSIPVGAGLSSSAALEVATLTFLEHFNDCQIESDIKRAKICQRAEHIFAGVSCGIMDQMIAIIGRKDFVLLLDCQSLKIKHIPCATDEMDLAILICNSNVRHELSSESGYLRRGTECTLALNAMSLESYRDVTEPYNLSDLLGSEGNELLLKRARHVFTEIQRVQDAAAALESKDFSKMGELMTQSHISLRDDFQVSCDELDVLVEAAIQCPGVLGSRMTGAGFGGCTVTLLSKSAIDLTITEMHKKFQQRFGQKASDHIEFYICKACQGARKLSLV